MSQLIVTGGRVAAGAAKSAATSLAKSAVNFITSAAVSEAQALIYGPAKRKVVGPRIESFRLQASTEGAPVPVVYGRARLAGQLIWASRFRETVSTQTTTSGGKGNAGRTKTTSTTYSYSVSIAIGLCEGPIGSIGRVWADGKLIDISKFDYRLHTGTKDQLPDSGIEAVEGVGLVPAYRGHAYIVFEELPLAEFGNRIPQFNFEIERQIQSADPDALENLAQAVCIIPATGEEAYGTTIVQQDDGLGTTKLENVHHNLTGTDFSASISNLQSSLPECEHAALFVSWFGTDLRAGLCQLMPGVETRYKTTTPREWRVNGVSRESAHLISDHDGGPAYGGTPSDQSVIEAIRDLNARGIDVLFSPFLLMDIPPHNALPLPNRTQNEVQGGYPWRGRIEPELGQVSGDVSAIFGAASPNDFETSTGSVTYIGPTEWSLRRMILHYAHLCKIAGGVESFLIGSEMRGLTGTHDDATFPAVEAYRQLAQDVRTILGPDVKISYGADWSEYSGIQGGLHPADRIFHLDSLWADPAIDFVGIDNYMPLSDWRPGRGHLDEVAGADSIYDVRYLKGNIRGGEGFDWYYASVADRDAQIRTPIHDTAHGEDWVFRVKDLWNWWGESHYNRPQGVKETAPTPWVPKSKPIRFTELGCGAVDLASNQPNVFYDLKSVDGARPYFSIGKRDDLIQRRFLEAHLEYWKHTENNPVSTIYDGNMVEADRIYLYAWDARPFPDFPARADVWRDTPNWTYGHWLNGRVGRLPLGELVETMVGDTQPVSVNTKQLVGFVTGYVIDRPMSVREMIEPLSGIFQFDVIEHAGEFTFKQRTGKSDLVLDTDDFVATDEIGPVVHRRRQESDLPASLAVTFVDAGENYDQAVVERINPIAAGERKVFIEAPIVMEPSEVEGRVANLLSEALLMRDEFQFSLRPSLQALEPGDVVTLTENGSTFDVRILTCTYGEYLEVEGVATASSLFDVQYGQQREANYAEPIVFGAPDIQYLDIPMLPGESEPDLKVAGFSSPWPGQLACYSISAANTPVVQGVIEIPARMGVLVSDLTDGPVGRWDRGASIDAQFGFGEFSSKSPVDVLGGGNLCAVKCSNGEWEIIQFQTVELIAPNVWRFSSLLRGQLGTDLEAALGAVSGARIVMLDASLLPLGVDIDQRGLTVSRRAGPLSDPVTAETFVQSDVTYGAVGLRPLSPGHLKALWVGENIELSWIRRTRIGGDSWEETEPPISEASEAYLIEVMNDGNVVRSLSANTSRVVYSAADIAIDFGHDGPGAHLSFAVAQISQSVGPGRRAEQQVPILA